MQIWQNRLFYIHPLSGSTRFRSLLYEFIDAMDVRSFVRRGWVLVQTAKRRETERKCGERRKWGIENRRSPPTAYDVHRVAPRRAAPEVRRMEGGAKTAETTTLTPFVYCS